VIRESPNVLSVDGSRFSCFPLPFLPCQKFVNSFSNQIGHRAVLNLRNLPKSVQQGLFNPNGRQRSPHVKQRITLWRINAIVLQDSSCAGTEGRRGDLFRFRVSVNRQAYLLAVGFCRIYFVGSSPRPSVNQRRGETLGLLFDHTASVFVPMQSHEF